MNNKTPRAIIAQISKIREASNFLIERELHSRGINGIVPAHGAVFNFLFRQKEPVPITALVKQSGRAKSTVTGIVKTLEQHGYLFRQDSAEDARSFQIGLTEKGRALESDFKEISDLLEKKVYGGMAHKDRENLMMLLGKIERNLGE